MGYYEITILVTREAIRQSIFSSNFVTRENYCRIASWVRKMVIHSNLYFILKGTTDNRTLRWPTVRLDVSMQVYIHIYIYIYIYIVCAAANNRADLPWIISSWAPGWPSFPVQFTPTISTQSITSCKVGPYITLRNYAQIQCELIYSWITLSHRNKAFAQHVLCRQFCKWDLITFSTRCQFLSQTAINPIRPLV